MKHLSGSRDSHLPFPPQPPPPLCSHLSLIKETVSRAFLSSFILRLSFAIPLSCYLSPWISALVSLCIWQWHLFPDKTNSPWLSWLCFLYCSSILWDLAAPCTLPHPCRDASGTTTSVQLWMLWSRDKVINKFCQPLYIHSGFGFYFVWRATWSLAEAGLN